MCGILGLVSKNISATDYNNFSNSLKKISRRGPDFTGIKKTYLDQYQILFGHNRLSIIDLSSNGNQPMLSSSKKCQITFN
jgi:asparagine synthase (glutamine-hydrolysing)